jgi:hypothetical protein
MEAGFPSQETYGYEVGPMEYGGPYETGAYESGPYETGPYETGSQYEYGPAGEIFGETGYETLRDPVTGEINTDMEIALAAELLSVGSDRELNQFLGKFVRRIGRRFGPKVLGTIFSALRPLAKAALPMLGGAIGSLIPIPGVGTALGSAAAGALGNAVGLEFQGLSAEDRDLEIARRIIRTGIETAQAIEGMPQGEVVMEDEIWNAVKAIASRALPSAVSLLTSGVTGSATAGAQGTGGLSGGLSVRSPGGWAVDLGGQAGGQVTSGTAVGINTPAPSVPFQPSPAGQVLPYPYQAGRVGPVTGGGRPPRPPVPGVCPPGIRLHGRWVRRGRAIILLGVC